MGMKHFTHIFPDTVILNKNIQKVYYDLAYFAQQLAE